MTPLQQEQLLAETERALSVLSRVVRVVKRGFELLEEAASQPKALEEKKP